MLLSDGFAAATTDAQRASLASSADTLIAATNAVSWAGILTAAAILLLSLVMRRGISGMPTAVLGILAGAMGILCEAFRPLIGGAYLLYGLALPVWFGMIGWRLLMISSPTPIRAGAPA